MFWHLNEFYWKIHFPSFEFNFQIILMKHYPHWNEQSHLCQCVIPHTGYEKRYFQLIWMDVVFWTILIHQWWPANNNSGCTYCMTTGVAVEKKQNQKKKNLSENTIKIVVNAFGQSFVEYGRMNFDEKH